MLVPSGRARPVRERCVTRKSRRRAVTASLGLAVVVAACPAPPPDGERVGATPVPRPVRADDVLAIASDGTASVTVVNLWATWCAPCREELPALLEMRRDLAPQGVRLVLVSVDDVAAPESVASVLAGLGVDFPTYLQDRRDRAFASTLHPRWAGDIPATLLYDREGTRRRLLIGRQDRDALVSAVREILGP